MKRILLLCLCLCVAVAGSAKKKEKRAVVCLETSVGLIRVALLDEAPRHRDNFLKLCREGFYDGTLFHRVIKDFMIQGGDPDSRNASPGQELGEGDVGYTLPPEFLLPYYYHTRGALAAAREGDDVNPEQRSSGCQYYIVWGKSWGPQSIRKQRDYLAELGIEMTAQMQADYEQYGGSPHLDGQYTVFGEVIEGLDVVKQIQSVTTDSNDRPLDDVVVLRAVVEQGPRE
ncbi:MAG: peptidylprolyl isomerase [Bacteroidaceae bacterium]|nr:peptidylprolyl isomerase [Bacteroidaceae bacterium]